MHAVNARTVTATITTSLAALFAASVAYTALFASPAGADTTGNATTNSEGIEHGVSITIDIPPRHSASSTTVPPCGYTWMDLPSAGEVSDLDGTPLTGDGTGQWLKLA